MLRQADCHKFETDLGHIMISSPAWSAVGDPVPTNKNLRKFFFSDIMNVNN